MPADAPATVLRPALIGITPRGNGPPPDVVQDYLELVGMKPQEPRHDARTRPRRPGRCLLARSPRCAQVPPQLDRLQRADGARVVPDHFLRRWDPVTVLFPTATGPAGGGPEDAPERFATLAPPKPGAWTWLTPTTLQFRPTEPWEPLRRETVTVGGAATSWCRCCPLPTATGPSRTTPTAPPTSTRSPCASTSRWTWPPWPGC